MDHSATKPLGGDTSNAAQYLVPCGILAALGTILCALRIYTRIRSRSRFHADDYMIIVTVFISVGGYFCQVAAAAYGWGRYTYYVGDKNQEKALKATFACTVCWIVGIHLARATAAVNLLRYNDAKWWHWLLRVILFFQCIIPVGSLIFLFAQCQPLAYNWKTIPDAKCWPWKYNINYGWTAAGIFVVTDCTLALLPIHILRKLHRPLRERLFIGFLMALGLLATAVLCVKMTTFNSFGSGNPLRDNTYRSLLAKLEEQVAIIAICLPSLKAPLETVLHRFGLLTAHTDLSASKVTFVHMPPADQENVLHLAPWNDKPVSEVATEVDVPRLDSVMLESGSEKNSLKKKFGNVVNLKTRKT